MVRPAVPADVPAVARLHIDQIGQGFLATLGPDFLERLYRRILRAPACFLLIAEAGPGGPIGFVAGAEHTSRLYADFLLRDGLVAAWRARRRLASSASKAWETLSYARPPTGPKVALPPAELLSVAVASGQQGRGVGSALVSGFVAEMCQRGVPAARVTVASTNVTAIRLYRAHGFGFADRLEVHRGQSSEVLVWRR